MAYRAGAYPGFCTIKRLRSIPTPPRWDASPSQGYLQHKFAETNLYTWVERGTVRVKCLGSRRIHISVGIKEQIKLFRIQKIVSLLVVYFLKNKNVNFVE